MRFLTFLLFASSYAVTGAADEYKLKYPLGLKPMSIPKGNELTAAKIELGKQLFSMLAFRVTTQSVAQVATSPQRAGRTARPLRPAYADNARVAVPRPSSTPDIHTFSSGTVAPPCSRGKLSARSRVPSRWI